MKKSFTFLFFIFFVVKSFAQLDTEHWFAPMMDRTSAGNQMQSIYFSTNSTTAFPVTIYNNNIAIGVVTISKGNPQKFSVLRKYIITTDTSDLFAPNSMGIYLKADYPFYANLRFSVNNHAEILTSKGKAGIGTKFYAAMAPISVNNGILNFMTGILATEDNTTVTVSGYQSSVQFSTPQNNTINFTLNKGQSYIIDGKGNNINNWTGFIGAKIVSNKPISVTNGNFNGQYAGDFSGSSDILMDQSVPVERLGQEFALVKGNGAIGENMEGGLIVATENDTEIYVNDILTPVVRLDEGQFYRLPETYYIDKGNGVFNMYVKSTKNIYLYELLAGANTIATGGFNYIPPLSCYLPKKIDEIGLINENPGTSGNSSVYSQNRTTKLNIITEAGAIVSVNGITPTPLQGPYSLIGNLGWVTYSLENVTGNITVNSTKAVTAGIAAGDGNVGYGGYFAGFSSIPAISKKTGTCLPGIVLEVNDGFDHYQWYLNNLPIQGANLNTFTPNSPGNYTVKVSTGSCSEVTTPIFTVLNCPKLTTVTKAVCSSFSIIPRFTISPQNIVLNTLKITTSPTKGTVTFNPTTGEITYTPNAGTFGADSFTYKFCGDGAFEDCEEVTVNITIGQLQVKNANLTSCKINDKGTFDLSTADISSNNPITKKYYKTLVGAQSEDPAQEILNFSTYNSVGGDVYAVVKTPEGCSEIATITLGFFPEIILDTNLYNPINCDDNFDGKIDIDFSQINSAILQNSTYFQVRYYLNQTDATAGNANNLPNNWSYNSDTPVFVRVDSPDNCPFKTAKIDFKIGNKLIITTPVNQTVCSENTSENLVFSDYLKFFTSDNTVTFKFYKTLEDAKANVSGTEISSNETITSDTTFFIRFSKVGLCDNIGTLNLKFAKPLNSTTLPTSVTVCEGSKTTLDAGSGFISYLWNTGEITQSIIAGVGNYTVKLTSPNGCSLVQSVEVKESLKAVLNTSNYTAENCDVNFDGTVDIKFSDITPIILQNSTEFTVKYYSTNAYAQIGGTNNLPDNYSYSSDVTVYVRVESNFCPPVIQPLNLKVGTSLPLIKTIFSTSECDDDLDNIKSVDLSKYLSQFTTDSGVNVSYYDNLDNAKNSQNAISNPASVNKSGTYYFRISKTGFCPVLATLNITINIPKASSILVDQSICPNTKTILDAGSGFISYSWSTGEKTSFITVGIGDYYVDLETGNGCIYRQKVSVKEVELPKITAIDIQGTTVTITAEGGNKPYYYSLNGSSPQTSNVFTNVKSGPNTIFVTSADQCTPVSKDFSLIVITNVITPNGDGINDTFNYENLRTKDNPKFEIYDRYGKLVFKGSENNNYTWDGTFNNRKLSTDSYWYILEWHEFGVSTNAKYTGWVLLKNTNF
ncbi:T9SS type B sorting domain-containing protein [Halpernia sp.]|uniref:T9SS type B sorting domain-containing protein n=1 Tax=Halpernia sp. TaxID=2782209 RepID=UPI003A8FD535